MGFVQQEALIGSQTRLVLVLLLDKKVLDVVVCILKSIQGVDDSDHEAARSGEER